MNKLSAILAALRYGSALSDSATWKHRQNLLNALVGLLGAGIVLAGLFGVNLNVSSEDIATIAGAIATVYGLFNPVITTATTDKIGLPPQSPTDTESGSNGNDYLDRPNSLG